jgi:hypothetical protein
LQPLLLASVALVPVAVGERDAGTLPLADAAEGYRAMDERRAIKTMLRL